MSLELADSISIEISESNTNIDVAIAGVQGPIGPSGATGPAGTGSSISNLSGYITTGDADQRYYALNNPSGFLSSNQTGQFYPASNPNQFIRSGDVSSLYYTKNNESGFLNSLSGLSTGYIQTISGILDTKLQSTGSNLDGKINSLSGYSNNTFATISNLLSTGQQSYNLILGLSGQLNSTGNNLQTLINTERNKETITGISISGSNSLTGLINLTGIGGLQIYQYGNNIQFSGGGTSNVNNVYNINSGSGIFIYRSGIPSGIDKQFVLFPTILDNRAIVLASLHNDYFNTIPGYQISGTVSSGFWVIFSTSLPNTGYYLDILATNATETGMAATVVVNTTNIFGITGIGTINYIPKFINLSGLGNSNIIDSGNKIYIGSSLSVDNSGILYFNNNSGDAGNLLVKSTGQNSMEYFSLASPKRFILREEFVGGTNSDGQRGDLSWRGSTIGAGSPSYNAGFSSNPGDSDHYGILNVVTTTTSGNGAQLWLGYQSSNQFTDLVRKDWDSYWVFKLSHSGASMGFRCGFMDSTATWESNQGLMLRYDPSGYNDTGYMCVSRANAVNTQTGLGIAPDGNWHTLRMWKYKNTGIVNFSFDYGSTFQINHTHNNGAKTPFFSIITLTGAACTASLDYFGFEGFANR